MQYRQLGKSGVRVSAIGLGTGRFGHEYVPQEEVNRLIDAALDLGINFIDSADVYQGGRSEETIGAAMRGRRDRFVIATKFRGKIGEGPPLPRSRSQPAPFANRLHRLVLHPFLRSDHPTGRDAARSG